MKGVWCEGGGGARVWMRAVRWRRGGQRLGSFGLTSYWGGKVAGHTHCTCCSQQLVVVSFILN